MLDLVRVFLSHTSMMAEVPEGRSFVQAATDAINGVADSKAHDMRHFHARDQSPADYSAVELLDTDVYVGIIGFDYGSEVGGGDQRSFTELEFDLATAAGMERLLFLLDDSQHAGRLPGRVFTATTEEQVAFRTKLKASGATVAFFGTRDELQRLVLESIRDAIERRATTTRSGRPPRPGQLQPASAPKLLLTSESPRRRALMEQIGFRHGRDYVTVDTSVQPTWQAQGRVTLRDARRTVVETAREKVFQAVRRLRAVETFQLDPHETVVVGADTIVLCQGCVLDRPTLAADVVPGTSGELDAIESARRMLIDESGKEIHVITGLAAACADDLSKFEDVAVTTTARLRSFDADEVDRYIRSAEPFDKAGGFGIQEQGVALFEGLRGSYTNVVGLPILEFLELLERPQLQNRIPIPEIVSSVSAEPATGIAGMSVVSVGDISYDISCDDLSPGGLEGPGHIARRLEGDVIGAVGGSAVHFARAARDAGFESCSVVGALGADDVGRMIEEDLDLEGIRMILPLEARAQTGISITLRESGAEPATLDVVDVRESLPDDPRRWARSDIESTDVVYLSGSCFADPNQRATAAEIARMGRRARRLVVIDVPVGMATDIGYSELCSTLAGRQASGSTADILVAPLTEVVRWFGLDEHRSIDEHAWLHEEVLPRLHRCFPAVLLWDRDTEVFSTPDGVGEPVQASRTTGHRFADAAQHARRVADRLHQLLSPRVLLASGSPQRRELLAQIIAPGKVESVPSGTIEAARPGESVPDRVARLALEKAESIFATGRFSDHIELVIGADTEIAVDHDGRLETIGHPSGVDRAVEALRRLSGREHVAVTGMAVIGRDRATGTVISAVETVRTRVWFRPLDDDEIRRYAEAGEAFGKAGGYAIQGIGGRFVEDLDGSYSNVVGLPLERLAQVLRERFGRSIWDFDAVSNWMAPHPLHA